MIGIENSDYGFVSACFPAACFFRNESARRLRWTRLSRFRSERKAGSPETLVSVVRPATFFLSRISSDSPVGFFAIQIKPPTVKVDNSLKAAKGLIATSDRAV
ncbi:MAG: hypothetical protein JSR62_15570 [Nitrospira sp.]|nr:hypothetical protein [Nitrospira sp.]